MEEILTVLGVFAAFIVIVGALGLAEKKRYREAVLADIRRSYGKFCTKKLTASGAEHIPAYFNRHSDKLSIDNITASDLELDRLFMAMNVTYSAAGEECLYHHLRTPLFDETELKKRRELMELFDKDKELREKLQFLFAGMGKSDKYSLYDYLDLSTDIDVKALKLHILAPLLVAAAVAVTIFYTAAGIPLLIGVLIFNMSWYFREKGRVQPYIVTLKAVMREIRGGYTILSSLPEAASEEKERLKECLEALKRFSRGSSAIYSGGSAGGDPLQVAGDYLNMLLHPDMIAFGRMFGEMKAHVEDIDRIHGILGHIEALIAAASFRRSLSTCEPVFDGKESAKGIYHPLIEDPVVNDYELGGCMLLTGSNASGKSTFLKTMAVNQLLGQCFGFACAEEFHTDFHRIYTSMALRDDLEHGESYFMAEIKAMRRILKAGEEEGAKIACYVDEVLKGTNTVERIAASSNLLKTMKEKGYFCCAATHDIELTGLLEGIYENYHFEEEIIEGDVCFNYKLNRGRATSRNAIKLLSVMGYDEKLVKEAEEMAGRFAEEGRWSFG
ncbi:MAG: hypothetical protein IKI75_07515 [Lachnospiraceae bacterium]|nr:hypothetical protein [Lachnospiraceae bacterium]